MNSSEQISYFDEIGWRRLTKPYRVFDKNRLTYYSIKNYSNDYKKIYENFKRFYLKLEIDFENFKNELDSIRSQYKKSIAYSALFNGIHIPFILPRINCGTDISQTLITDHLSTLEASFKNAYPSSHFRATMQSGASLNYKLNIAKGSRYEKFIEKANQGAIIGWYFPQALQQFDIDSQIEQMKELPEDESICLSGPAEIISSIIGKPDLLINEDGYSPILTMSAICHTDDRLILLLKSYGPHLEFWCLSQMLVPGVKQVSEQWSGGITIFKGIPK